MLALILPFGFLLAIVWLLWWAKKQADVRKTTVLENRIRNQVYQEQQLGGTRYEVVVSLLLKSGGMSAADLMQATHTDKEEMMDTIRELLQSKRIRQDVHQQPSTYYVANETAAEAV